MDVNIARVVIECAAKPPWGLEYRVWTEHNGEVFDEVKSEQFATAVGALMHKVEGPDLAAFEPVYE